MTEKTVTQAEQFADPTTPLWSDGLAAREPLSPEHRRFLAKHVELRHVKAKSEDWHLSFWADGREPGVDAVSVEVERNGHNFAPTLSPAEAGALIDALLQLLPVARRHSKLCGSQMDVR